jgi:phenylalanyl-tRNA synthetase beta chain
MVSFKIAYSDVLSLLRLDPNTSVEKLDDLFSFAKCEIEEYDLDDDYLKVECKTSNRPDIWSCEGLVREVSGIIGLHKGLPNLSAEPSGYIIEVDPRLKTIRPYIACSIVKGVQFSDFLIKQLIQLQEKVDFSYGRKRRRSSIGIYNLHPLESPIYYKLIPRTSSFIPLGYYEEMTLEEILEKHEKGLEYGHILPDKGDLPILQDVNGMTLSMPPIINSNDVGRVTEETTDVLVEVTGTNLEVVQVVTLIVTQALRDRGGTVFSVEVNYPENHGDAPRQIITPDSELKNMEIDPKDINRYLDTDLSPSEIIKLLEKRRLRGNKKKNTKKLLVQYPAYRQDLLHWVDIAEETAIAYGYMKFEPTELKFNTVGRLSPRTISENYVREILSSCALQEILTYTLTAPEKLTTLMGYDDSELSSCIRVANPVSLNYSVLRHRLLPGMLDFLAKNTHNEYPQYLFEIGETTTVKDKTVQTISKTAVTLAGANTSFEYCHSILDRLFQQLGTDYELTPAALSEFIEGRTANIKIEKKTIGIIGEVSPSLLENWQIFVPVTAFEIDLSLIPTLELPPLLSFNPGK